MTVLSAPQSSMQSLVSLCALLSFLSAAQADVVQRFEVWRLYLNITEHQIWVLHRSTKEHLCIFFFYFPQDEPECMKYFYREKVPEWGGSTPGAVRLCQRFVNRWGWSVFTLISISIFSHTLFAPCNRNKKKSQLFAPGTILQLSSTPTVASPSTLPTISSPAVEGGERVGGLWSLRLVPLVLFSAPAAERTNMWVGGVPLRSVQLGFELNWEKSVTYSWWICPGKER